MRQECFMNVNDNFTHYPNLYLCTNSKTYKNKILINLCPINKRPFQWALKRVFDIVCSLLAMIVLLPVFVLLIIIIRLDSKGPAIFKQKRVGLNKKEFYMYKFRSMVQDAEKKKLSLKVYNQTNPIMFKMHNDPRLTKIGKFIRKYSIDELPQLINVLRGEMSLVGPRPPLLSELSEYKLWHNVRFATLPGLTGLWQVSGRSNIKDFDQVVSLDYKYISNWNFGLDIKLILKTVPVVLLGLDAA